MGMFYDIQLKLSTFAGNSLHRSVVFLVEQKCKNQS
jgi:hypothetical protein